MNVWQKWCLAGLLCVVSVFSLAQPPAERQARWEQDLKILVDTLRAPKTGQIDVNRIFPPPAFDAAIANLKADIPNTPDDELSLRLMQLMAGPHVAHDGAFPQDGSFVASLPLRFYWYSDGLAVYSASQEYIDTVGAKVITIGDTTPNQILAKLAPYIPYENEQWLRVRAPEFLREEAFLRHLNLLASDGKISITLQKPGQPPFTISVSLADPMPKLIRMPAALHLPAPLAMSHLNKNYWYQYLDDSQTLFIQYNQCKNDPQLNFKDFAQQISAQIDTHPPKRVVLDLRDNGGGDSSIIDPLQTALDAHSASIGHLFVLISPWTFSSAMLNAFNLQRGMDSYGHHVDLKATLVGEPTGDGLNTYGNIRELTLPNSRINVYYTTKFFGNRKTAPLPAQPDIPVPHTLADDLTGRDSALEAAIAAP